jgi:hypothetical protein
VPKFIFGLPVEFPQGDPGDPAAGVTLGQVELVAEEIVADLEPPIDLTLLFENALT